MKILSSFTHPQVVSNLWISFFCWKQKKIFWRMSVTRQLMDPIDLHRKKKIQWRSMGPINSLVTDILQNIFFCVQQKKEIHKMETTWGWVNDRIFILKWTNPLTYTSMQLHEQNPFCVCKCIYITDKQLEKLNKVFWTFFAYGSLFLPQNKEKIKKVTDFFSHKSDFLKIARLNLKIRKGKKNLLTIHQHFLMLHTQKKTITIINTVTYNFHSLAGLCWTFGDKGIF